MQHLSIVHRAKKNPLIAVNVVYSSQPFFLWYKPVLRISVMEILMLGLVRISWQYKLNALKFTGDKSNVLLNAFQNFVCSFPRYCHKEGFGGGSADSLSSPPFAVSGLRRDTLELWILPESVHSCILSLLPCNILALSAVQLNANSTKCMKTFILKEPSFKWWFFLQICILFWRLYLKNALIVLISV